MTLFWDHIVSFDQQLFLGLNGLHSGWSDWLFYWITWKYTWTPLYIFLFYWFLRVYGVKRGVVMLVVSLLAVLIADYITSGLMKPYFARLRPCHDPGIADLVNNVAGCGGKYGFASSHASTSFALAACVYSLSADRLRAVKWLFLWAAVYAYSRVAVGVHYPADILVGACIGIITGYFCGKLYNKFASPLV